VCAGAGWVRAEMWRACEEGRFFAVEPMGWGRKASPGRPLEPSEAVRAKGSSRRIGALAKPLHLGGADEVAACLERHAENAAHNLAQQRGGWVSQP
jgi:hypothetical protein